VADRELARRLPGLSVYGLQSPGQPPEDLLAMAALYAEAVRQVQPHGPYRLAGWSLGGVVALEVARRLAAAGERIELLALIDTASPVLWRRQPEEDEAGLVGSFALDLARLTGVPVPAVDLAGLDEAGALSLVLAEGQAAGVLPPGLEPSELRRLFERYRANRRALARYEPVPYPGEAMLFRSRERPAGRDDGAALGWQGLIARLRVREVPGDHYTLLQEHAGTVAEHLREDLGPGRAGGGGLWSEVPGEAPHGGSLEQGDQRELDPQPALDLADDL
jgi:thioesterase domain-containing protein